MCVCVCGDFSSKMAFKWAMWALTHIAYAYHYGGVECNQIKKKRSERVRAREQKWWAVKPEYLRDSMFTHQTLLLRRYKWKQYQVASWIALETRHKWKILSRRFTRFLENWTYLAEYQFSIFNFVYPLYRSRVLYRQERTKKTVELTISINCIDNTFQGIRKVSFFFDTTTEKVDRQRVQ